MQQREKVGLAIGSEHTPRDRAGSDGPPPADGFLRFVDVKKSYDHKTLVVKGFSVDVAKGEFITLLGPSGSGKTTILMLLAGFESVTGGDILIDGVPVTRTAPYNRNIGMVFQNYALFPHMTVAENLAFPLKVRKWARTDIDARVAEYLDLVELGGFGLRFPAQLSGGQRQRVALARALIFEPSLVLMDEPLGALDKKLREQMQFEIKRLHQKLGFTVLYVTHDQTEALTMSDRIAVFNDGVVQQCAPPDTLYERPQNAFVADFIGENNFIRGEVSGRAGWHGPRGPAGRRPGHGSGRRHCRSRRALHRLRTAGEDRHRTRRADRWQRDHGEVRCAALCRGFHPLLLRAGRRLGDHHQGAE